MPLYRFIIKDGSSIPQPDPVELADLSSAKSYAAVLTGQLLKDADGHFWEDSRWTISVTDVAGQALATLEISGTSVPETA